MKWAQTNTQIARRGFTIVELLIVIVVIAILAAISIVAYTGIQNRAYNSAVQSDLKSAYTQLQLFQSESETGAYPWPPTASIGFKPTRNAYETGRNNYYYCASADRQSFAVSGIAKGGTSYSITSNGNLQQGVANGGDATCGLIGGGSWGSGMSSNGSWANWVN